CRAASTSARTISSALMTNTDGRSDVRAHAQFTLALSGLRTGERSAGVPDPLPQLPAGRSVDHHQSPGDDHRLYGDLFPSDAGPPARRGQLSGLRYILVRRPAVIGSVRRVTGSQT